ncbi:tctex-1 family protein [Cystoisospora suis]|uniref:Tctex-1 family protein n=1 Tax=Cystoisospora suis TaxID=483139 RepID=A0A2C6KMD1_9APIC|nr:tctex-1 family protein [Cystoisospora suis]
MSPLFYLKGLDPQTEMTYPSISQSLFSSLSISQSLLSSPLPLSHTLLSPPLHTFLSLHLSSPVLLPVSPCFFLSSFSPFSLLSTMASVPGGAMCSSSSASAGGTLTVYENTYRLGPAEEEKFFPSRIENLLERVMTEYFRDKSFNAEQGPVWAQEASARIMEEMRDLQLHRQQMPRFKIVVQVVIVENSGQGIRVSSKSLWDVNLDNWASYTHVQADMYAIAMVFGCYRE